MKLKVLIINFSIVAGSLILAIVAYAVTNLIITPSFQNQVFQQKLCSTISLDSLPADIPNIKQLAAQAAVLKSKLNKLNPGKQYLVINTSENTFKLYKNGTLLHGGICSTGSYTELEVEGNKSYKFETPRGVFTIKSKIVDPVWKKPDWAFAEEGLPIPPANHESRFEYGVLGDYALNLGNGYLIHGTLYQRFLGMPVTHGCVRLGDADLKLLYEELSVGTKVFIY